MSGQAKETSLPRTRSGSFLGSNLRRNLMDTLRPLLGLLVIWAVLFILAPTFRQWMAIRDILEQSTVLFIMAAGTTIILVSGGLDLSIGSILALVSVVTGSLLTYAGWSTVPAVLVGLGVGVLCGLVNGLVIVKTGVPTLVVTLGTMLIFRGVSNMLGAGKDMSRFPPQFQWLGHGFTGPVVISVASLIVIWFILAKTKLGFNAYAIGGNEDVAHLSGVNVGLNKVVYYGIGGLMAGLASIVQTSRLDFAHTNRGQSMELWAIAATVIGGTSMAGGAGGVFKTLIGTLIIQAVRAGLIHLHLDPFWQLIALGLVLILAVWLDFLQRRARERAA